MPSSEWAKRANCINTPTDWFFEDTGANEAVRSTCKACPVRAECLEAALREESGTGAAARHGFRGGKTAAERHAIAKATGSTRRRG